MSDFVGDNPVVMSGTMIARGDEQIVVGDDLGNTLSFRWTDAATAHQHGSPAAISVELPAGERERRVACFGVHSEGKYAQVRYTVEPLENGLRLVSYTVIEDIGALLSESEAPGLLNHAADEGSRMSVGPS